MTVGNIQEPTRNEAVVVGTSNVILSEARNEDNKRKDILVRNISPNAADIISVNVGYGQAVANQGIVLKQYESFTYSTSQGYEPYQGVITAVCATVNGKVAIFER